MEASSLRRANGLALPRSRRLLSALDDERLVRQLRRGNEVAFEVVYDRHHRGVLAYCRHMLGSREEAEDALQQIFAAAYHDLLAHERDVALKPWLYAIARNRCLSMLRARREQPAPIDESPTAGLSDEVERRADLRQLLSDLRELPEPQRAALVLAEVGDLGHADIAHVLECDVGKVKSLVFQARSGLIERRTARETPCEEIRAQLATLRGGSLRRGPLRRHLKACPACSAYREGVRRQRQLLAVALPVVPSLGLKESVLGAIGAGAAGAGAAGGLGTAGGLAGTVGGVAGATGGGGGLGGALGAIAAKGAVAKVAIAIAAGGAAAGGGAAVVSSGGDSPAGERTPAPAPERPAAPAAGTPGEKDRGDVDRDGEPGDRRAERAQERARDERGRRRRERAERRRQAADERRREAAEERRRRGERGSDGRGRERRDEQAEGRSAQPKKERSRRRRGRPAPRRPESRRREPARPAPERTPPSRGREELPLPSVPELTPPSRERTGAGERLAE